MDVPATPTARASGPLAAPPTVVPAAPAPPPAAARPDEPPVPSEAGRATARSSLAALKITLAPADVGARFAIDDATRRVTVTMYDRRTGEVLREIPAAQVGEMLAAGDARGIVVDAER